MKTTNRIQLSKSLVVALLGALMLSSASVAMAQVYGVRRTTAVVSTPNRTVVASRTTVVAGRGVATLPHGYIATLPGGYRPVMVSGVRYYTIGGVYYRPQIYGGQTVYVVAHI
jgi:hypothetical protein